MHIKLRHSFFFFSSEWVLTTNDASLAYFLIRFNVIAMVLLGAYKLRSIIITQFRMVERALFSLSVTLESSASILIIIAVVACSGNRNDN